MHKRRYYGESLPFPVGNDTTKEQWQFHTVDQALEDVVYFAERFTFSHPDRRTASYRPTPASTPWIMIGGSYPGVRAAYLRIRNPETIYSSWSSSGPVEAQIDMSSYWQAAERAIPRNCSNDWVAVTKYFDQVLTSGSVEEIHDLKVRLLTAEFTGPGGDTTKLDESGYLEDLDQLDAPTLAYFLMDPLGDYQVCSPQVNKSLSSDPSLTEQRNSPNPDVLRCHGDLERDGTCLLGGLGR